MADQAREKARAEVQRVQGKIERAEGQLEDVREERRESLRAYRQRFRKAIEAYRAYLADPNWRPAPSRAQRSKNSNGEPAKRQRRDSRKEAGEQLVPSSPVPSADLIAYPFPLKNGQMAQLHLPKQGLDRDDSDRLTHFIRALVFDQPAQLNAGDRPEDE